MAQISNQLQSTVLSFKKGAFYVSKDEKGSSSVYDLCLHSMYFWQEAFYAREKMKKKVGQEAVLW